MTVVLESLGGEFCRSLEKAAGPMLQAAVQRGLGGVGAGAGVGALAGAGIGAVRGYRQARQDGQGVGGALAGGLGGAAKGVLPGAAVGAAGLGAVQAAGGMPGLAGRLTAMKGPVGAFARSGQRQVHGFTGWTPRGFGDVEGARQIGLGSADAAKRHSAALKQVFSGAPKDQLEMSRASKQLAVTQKAEHMGLTNLPGFAKSLAKNPVDTIRTGLAGQWHGADTATKALTLGLPAMSLASEMHKSGPEAEGRGGRLLGQAASLVTMPFGAMPQMTQMALGSGVNKAVNRLRHNSLGQNPAPPEVHPSGGGLAAPIEHQYSDRASGQIRVGENS